MSFTSNEGKKYTAEELDELLECEKENVTDPSRNIVKDILELSGLTVRETELTQGRKGEPLAKFRDQRTLESSKPGDITQSPRVKSPGDKRVKPA